MLEIDLSGRIAIVTGGSRGIGRATVELLAEAGARVVIGCHERRDEGEALVDEIGRLGGEAVVFAGDLSDAAACRDLVDTAVREFGGLHAVINNAGIWRRADIDVMSEEELAATVDLNLKAIFRISRHAARALGKEPAGGSIIHIASTAGERGEAHYSHYAATKGALIAMAKSHAAELAPRIRVNVVSPGWVETEMTADALRGEERRRIEREIPLARVGQPRDVAGAVVWLCSDLAAWVTGAVIRVNGGAVMGEM